MENSSSKKIEYKIGLFLIFLYIFVSYVAVDILIPTKVTSVFLYAFLAWGVLVVLMKCMNEPLPTYTLWYATFMTISFLTMGYSKEFNILSGEFYLMIISFLLTFLFQIFIRDEKDFKRLCWFYAVSSLSLVLMLQFTGNLVGDASNRLGQDLMGNANNFAMLIMIAVFYELWLFVHGTKTLYAKIILVTMIVYNMYALGLSAGRKFILMPFVFLYVLLLCKTNKKGKQNIIIYTLVFVLIVVGAYNIMMTNEVLYEAVGVRMESFIEGQQDESKLDNSSKIRDVMRSDAIEQWWERPFLGYGFDSYKFRAKNVVGETFYSHCNYTEMLYNGGIVMFIAYYWIYAIVLKEYKKRKSKSGKFCAFALASAISFFIFDYGAVSYSIAQLQIVLCLALKTMSFETNDDIQEEELNNEQIENNV
ncbi:MAG: hypothetical protein E7391_05840 [Ruminococcaceae bacterium]|nr:hypothetical protein [Oscillospiraceae bacterium]